MKVALVTTHPVQYQAPWIRLLFAQPGIEGVALYAMLPDAARQGEGFGLGFEWDTPLLGGYRHRVLRNVARNPSVVRGDGCDTPELFEVLREEKADAVVVNGWGFKTCRQALAASRRLRIPCLVRGESNLFRPRPGWKRLAHRILLRRYAAFLAIGKANRAFYLAHGVSAGRIFDTPYGVDNEFFAARAATARGERAALRQRWGLPPEGPVFLFAGKFEEKKRPGDLLRVARRVREQGAAAHFLMVGAGALLDECQSAVRAEALPVSFAGFLNQSEMPSAYAAADALILPSDHGETWGLVVNEAMACGLPAYVSDQVGCHPDLIVEGVTGRVFRVGDCRDLAGALVEDVAAGRLADMGCAALLRVSGHTFSAVVDGVRKALDSVVRS